MIANRFDISISNIPVVNLRSEFASVYAFVQSESAAAALTLPPRVIQTRMFIWTGMPAACFTLLLQRSILGVEAYLPAALTETATMLGKLGSVLAKIRKPSDLGSNAAATNIYHSLPAEVLEDLSLKTRNRPLYDRNQVFYSTIRNPLFHGGQIYSPSIAALRDMFDHIAMIYEWIDGWYDLDNIWLGATTAYGQLRSRPAGT
jgi:hypothetical protein